MKDFDEMKQALNKNASMERKNRIPVPPSVSRTYRIKTELANLMLDEENQAKLVNNLIREHYKKKGMI